MVLFCGGSQNSTSKGRLQQKQRILFFMSSSHGVVTCGIATVAAATATAAKKTTINYKSCSGKRGDDGSGRGEVAAATATAAKKATINLKSCSGKRGDDGGGRGKVAAAGAKWRRQQRQRQKKIQST
jgi:hypothetical protein